MFIRKLTFTALIIAGIAGIAGTITMQAEARAPSGASPGPSCKSTFVASHTQRATKLDKARQRARGNWETQARRQFGGNYNDWRKTQYKQYGCSKRGRYHYCVAEGFPCSQIEEVAG